MSRGLGEVQIQALRVFIEHEDHGGITFGDDSGKWLSLRVIKLWAWGAHDGHLTYHRGTPEQLATLRQNERVFMQTGHVPENNTGWSDGIKPNLHGPFKRALELLVRRGCLRARNELQSWQWKKRKRRDRYYQITKQGKCELCKVHTYRLGLLDTGRHPLEPGETL